MEAAESSDDFRKEIQKIYKEEFMTQSGLFGDGYKYDQKFMWDRVLSFSERQRLQGAEETARGFIQVRDHHVGWVAVHHPIGTVGFIAFIVLCLSSLAFVFRSVWKIPKGMLSPPQVWSSALIVQIIISFFAVFGAMHNFLPQLCVLLGACIVSYRQAWKGPDFLPELNSHTSPHPTFEPKPVLSG